MTDDRPTTGTRVTATDVVTGQHDAKIIRDDYVLITDGRVYLHHRQVYKNGTVVLTIKRGPEVTR